MPFPESVNYTPNRATLATDKNASAQFTSNTHFTRFMFHALRSNLPVLCQW